MSVARLHVRMPVGFLLAALVLAAAAWTLGSVLSAPRPVTTVTWQKPAGPPATNTDQSGRLTRTAPAAASEPGGTIQPGSASGGSAAGSGGGASAVTQAADAGPAVVAPGQSVMCGPRPCPHR